MEIIIFSQSALPLYLSNKTKIFTRQKWLKPCKMLKMKNKHSDHIPGCQRHPFKAVIWSARTKASNLTMGPSQIWILSQ